MGLRWRALGAALATGALVAAVLAVRATGSPGAGTPLPPPRAPVLTLARAPELAVRLDNDARRATALDGALADPALSGARNQACLVIDDGSGAPVYSRQPDQPLTPASNLKLFTAFAALQRLGADFRFHTEADAAAPAQGGAIPGDLWLVGSGDPLLATADFAAVAGYEGQPRAATPLETLADRIVASGVHAVGRVVGDESRYDGVRYVPTWKPSYISDAEVGPASALTVNDGFAAWKPRPVPAPAPATNAAAVLASLLQARGVAVGGVAEGVAPAAHAAIASVDSPPLATIAGEMLRQSDNLAAELLVKELGKRFGGGGTTSAGVAIVRETVAGAGVEPFALSAVDGSGLDVSDRTTCATLAALLRRAGDSSALARDLPVAARDGTLARRFVGTPVAGRLQAKTGSLAGVAGLSGWATTTQGQRLVFSLLVNGLPRDAAGQALEDRVATALVTVGPLHTADELAP